jgi:mRNA interferase HicA
MKRQALLRHLRRYGCYLKREGAAHSLWINPLNGAIQTVPRHTEIPGSLPAESAKGWGFPIAVKNVDKAPGITSDRTLDTDVTRLHVLSAPQASRHGSTPRWQ